MRQCGSNVKNSSVCIMSAQYTLNPIFSLEPVSSRIDLAVGEKTEKTYLLVVFDLL